MNTLIVAVGIFACIALAASEPCHGDDTSQCTHELCGSNKVACSHGLCTCIVDYCDEHNLDCRGSASHCEQNAHQHHCSCAHNWHCIDNKCGCGFPSK